MTFLPMVERELRAASRRRMTYWSRWLAAMAAVALFGLFYTASITVGLRFNYGEAVFGVLLVAGLIYCLVEAIRTGADCLSQEKREGTIGLLFLTDLTGMDVVLGKLAAAALQSIYALIAMFPILVLTIFVGGVTFGVVVREMLALLNLIFLAYALVIWCSARAYDAYRAVLSAFLWLTVLVVGTYITDAALGAANPMQAAFFGFLNPAFCAYLGFDTPYLAHPWWFWCSLGLVHVEAWLLVEGAAFGIRRHWEEVPSRTSPVEKPGRRVAGFGRKVDWSSDLRRRYLDRNPIQWLVRRMEQNTGNWMLWISGILTFILFSLSVAWDASQIQRGWMLYLTPLLYIIYLMLPARAGRLFARMRETGSWELLGCTPLKAQEIASGVWRGLRPTLIRLLIAGGIVKLGLSWEQTVGIYVYSGGPNDNMTLVFLELILALVVFGLDMVALGWVSVWLSLKASSLIKAVLLTLALVIVLPNVGVSFLIGFTAMSYGAGIHANDLLFWKLAVYPLFMIFKNVALIWWAQDNFRLNCRNLAELGHG